jgi:uncharacterized protein (DUF1810 family)
MMAMPDPFDLQRFLEAQSGIYERVLSELRSGTKRSHWMWFIFPQIAGLGSSPTAIRYAITSRAEALAYSEHPILGERLLECTGLVNAIEGRSISGIFGYPDDLKFHSSMTLFAEAASDKKVFLVALEKYFERQLDQNTLRRL